MLLGLCSALAACSASIPSDKLAVAPPTPQLARPDSALTKDCALPTDIGTAALAQSRVEKLWIADRRSLLDCGRTKKALGDFYQRRDDALTGVRK